MMTNSRKKGRRGESEAKKLLLYLGYEVDDMNNGLSTCDLKATDTNGIRWAVEVKKNKVVDIPNFMKQTRENVGRGEKWMLMCHIHGTREWLVMRQGERTEIWHQECHNKEHEEG